MKMLINAVARAAIFAAPIASFAQSQQPVTRAEIKTELKQLESVGYNPATATDAFYPSDIQAAEARVQAKYPGAQTDTTGYGSSANGSSQTGSNAPAAQ